MKTSKLTNTLVQAGVLLIAVAVLSQNILLLKDNRRMRQIIDNANIPPTILSDRTLRSMSAEDSNGQVQNISLPVGPAEKLLIITFSPGCPYCQASQPEWMDLSRELKARPGWRVLWVSRDSIKDTIEYCKKRQISLDEMVADPSYRTYMQLALKIVPNTIVVGAGGRVEKVWAGRIDTKERWSEIVSYFGLQQKDLSAASAGKDLSASAAR